MMKRIKSVVAAVLTLALAMNALPMELFGALIAYAEEAEAISEAIEQNCENLTDLPTLAAGLVGAGPERTLLSPPVTAIGDEAFLGCGMRYVDLGLVSTIGARAFAGTDSLIAIRIPASVLTIAEDAFADSDPRVICGADSAAYRFAVEHSMRVFCEE